MTPEEKTKFRNATIENIKTIESLQKKIEVLEAESIQGDAVEQWISVEDDLPKVEDKKMKPVLVLYEKYPGKFYQRVAYYFPEHFKTIEWEDWDDYSEADFPYTENDIEKGCVWLRPGFYDTVECDKCEGYWDAPLKVTHWQPLPLPPTKQKQ